MKKVINYDMEVLGNYLSLLETMQCVLREGHSLMVNDEVSCTQIYDLLEYIEDKKILGIEEKTLEFKNEEYNKTTYKNYKFIVVYDTVALEEIMLDLVTKIRKQLHPITHTLDWVETALNSPF